MNKKDILKYMKKNKIDERGGVYLKNKNNFDWDYFSWNKIKNTDDFSNYIDITKSLMRGGCENGWL